MKLVMSTLKTGVKCRICDKIDTKRRRRAAEMDRINRWKKGSENRSASIDKSELIIDQLERELADLLNERSARTRRI